MTRYNLLLAGGGTAGHIEPALAVAQEWKTRHPEAEITFLGTQVGLENSLVPRAGFPLRHIPKVAISRSLKPSLLKVPFQLISAVVQSIRALKDVDCAIGFGGYVSAPLYLAARLTRTPFVIHEQNAQPGWANKCGAFLTDQIALSYPISSGRMTHGVLTGLPLRTDVITALQEATTSWGASRREAKQQLCARYKLDSHRPLIFIFGGSQGSLALNTVIEKSLNTFGNCSIIHGVGRNNHRLEPSSHYVALEYIDDMATHYLAADIVIARSGAVTCAEFEALGKYALFIPLPIGNGEQAKNAQTLVQSGRAEIVEQSRFTSDWIASNLDRLISVSAMKSDEGSSQNIDAALRISAMIEKALGL